MLTTVICNCAGGLYSDGYDTYLDANGEVVNAYPVNYDQTLHAGLETLKKIGCSISNRYTGGNETTIEARTMRGSSLRIRYVREGRNLTVVRVRTGLLGYTDLEYSNQFHAFLAARLKRDNSALARPPEHKGPGSVLVDAGNNAATTEAAVNAPVPETTQGSATYSPKNDPNAAPAAHAMRAGDALQSSPRPQEPGTFGVENTPSATLAMLKVPAHPLPDYVIYFKKDSNIPPPEALKTLNQAAMQMQANPDAVIELDGFADAEEDPGDLHLVSEGRTLAVKSYLVGRGIESGRIRTTWHGSNFPKKRSGDGTRQRRVEIRLVRGL